MNEEKISVIVPAYNLASWLPRCLDSILAQAYENLEVIVVDDGSQDSTFSVIQAYAGKDNRIKAIQKENGGVTSARLRGIAESTGSWIGFVDGDDEIEPDMYRRLLENAITHNADISHCGYKEILPKGKTQLHYGSGDLHQQDRLTAIRDLLEERLVSPGLWNKLFKRELFQGLETWMDRSIKVNEDILMNYFLFSRAECAVYEDVCPYHYIIRRDSASRRKLNEYRIYDPIRVREIILENCGPELETDARQAMLRVCLYVYALLAVERGKEYIPHRKKVREIISGQREHFYVLTKRNQLLAQMICTAPWLFRGVFMTYVYCFRGGQYE